MGVAAILVMRAGPFEKYCSRVLRSLSLIGPVVSEDKLFENVDGRTTDGWTDGRTLSDWYTISSPMSLRLS